MKFFALVMINIGAKCVS